MKLYHIEAEGERLGHTLLVADMNARWQMWVWGHMREIDRCGIDR